MSEQLKGIIIKAIAGFYYVEVGEDVFECKARGIFRHNGESPLVGDMVEMTEEPDSEKRAGAIETVLPRKNFLLRPPLANIDRFIIVVSTASPAPNLMVIDRLTAIAEDNGIEPVIVINKTDIASGQEIEQIYKTAGFITAEVSCHTGKGIDDVKKLLCTGINVFAGNTGAGKSSILNLIEPRLELKTGEISEKLGRGRHTTRHVELFHLDEGGYIADTPGFSSLDMENGQWIYKENLQFAFREFTPYIGKCKFVSCTHTGEKGCAIGEAREKGLIPASRQDNYTALYREAQNVKDWERKK